MKKRIFMMIGSEIYRECVTWKYIAIVMSIALLLAFCNSSEIEASFIYRDAREMFSSARSLSTIFYMEKFKAAIVVLLSALVSISISEDFMQNYIIYYQLRMNAGLYVFIKIICNYLISIITMILGIWLYFLILLPVMPVEDTQLAQMGTQYGIYSNYADKPILYAAILGTVFGSFSSFLSAISMFISLWLPNKYLSLSIPFMFMYISYILTMNAKSTLDPMALTSGLGIFPYSSIGTLIYTLGIFLIGNSVIGMMMYISVRWRWMSE